MDSEPAELLFNRGTLMDLYIGKPTFQKKLKPNDILMDGINEDVLYLGHKKLLPKGATEALVTIEGKARKALSDRSIEFPISGARYVQYNALGDLLRSLQSLKEEWDKEVEGLVRDYPSLRTEQLSNLDKQAEVIVQKELSKLGGADRAKKTVELDVWLLNQRMLNRSLYPRTEDIPSMFKFQWRMFRISALSGAEELSTLQQSELVEARDALKRDLQQWVRRASAEMHRSLGEAALNAKSLLEKNGKLQPRNLKPLFDAFENFKAIDFTGSSTFQDLVNQIKNRFGVNDASGIVDYELTANSLNHVQGSMEQFRELLGQVSSLAQGDVAEKAGISALTQVPDFRRFIEV